ncbi:hypothetical protein ACKFRZ_01525 [Corynebacterium gottingense]|uniref:hypothetical protein n=2 Tax=Corynebacterium TaxID=1716 RepID=UPI0038D12702
MYLNSHIRKIFNRATVLASSACLAMAVAPVAVHAQESFIGEEAETTVGVINPNDQSTVSSFGPANGAAYLGSPIITSKIWDMFDSTASRPVK